MTVDDVKNMLKRKKENFSPLSLVGFEPPTTAFPSIADSNQSHVQ